MKKFKDSNKREWEIVVNVGTAKTVRDALGVDLFKLHSSEAEKVFNDPCLLVDVLYVLCRQQCEARKVTDEEFGRAMIGDAIEHGANALLSEVACFFPSSRRKVIEATMHKAEAVATATVAKMMQAVEAIDVAAMVEQQTTHLSRSIKLPASSA